jgi:hypothetical protein
MKGLQHSRCSRWCASSGGNCCNTCRQRQGRVARGISIAAVEAQWRPKASMHARVRAAAHEARTAPSGRTVTRRASTGGQGRFVDLGAGYVYVIKARRHTGSARWDRLSAAGRNRTQCQGQRRQKRRVPHALLLECLDPARAVPAPRHELGPRIEVEMVRSPVGIVGSTRRRPQRSSTGSLRHRLPSDQSRRGHSSPSGPQEP